MFYTFWLETIDLENNKKTNSSMTIDYLKGPWMSMHAEHLKGPFQAYFGSGSLQITILTCNSKKKKNH